MHNKKFLVLTTVILLLVLLSAFTLFACENKDDTDNPGINSGDNNEKPKPPIDGDDDDEEDEVFYSSYDALCAIIDSAPGEYVSLLLNGGAELNGKKYILDGKINVSENDTSLAIKFFPEGQEQVIFALYVVESKLYIETQDGAIYHISEINTTYLQSIINALPSELKELIEGVLADANLPLTLDTLIPLLIGMIAPNDVQYTNVDGVETFVIDLQPYKAISSILNLVQSFIKDIDLSFLNDFIALIPPFDGEINAVIDNGSLDSISVKFDNQDPTSDNYGQTMIGINSDIQIGDAPVDLGIPESIKDYKELSLTNLNADFSLALDTNGQDLDLGALIDSFLGEDAIFGQGTLMLNAGVQYTLQVKVNADANLDGLAEDNNLISLILLADGKEFVKAYYYEGKIYINVDNAIKVAIEFDLQAQITKLVDLITNAIDGFLGTEFKPAEGEVASISLNAEGDAILSSDLQTVINKVLGLVGFEEFVSVDGDSIELNINQAFLDKIFELIGSTPTFELPCDINILVQLGEMGLDYVEISTFVFGVNATLKAENFLIGTSDLTKENVSAAIGNPEDYSNGISGAVISLLGGLGADLTLNFNTGDNGFDIGAFIDRFLGEDAMFGNGTFMLNANMNYKLSIQANLDANSQEGILIAVALTTGEETIATINYANGTFYANIQDNIKVAYNYDLSVLINELLELIDGALGSLPFNQTSQIGLANEKASSNLLTLTLTNEVLNNILALAGVNAINFDEDINIQLGFESASIDYLQVSLLDNMAVLTADNLAIGHTSLTLDKVEQTIGDKSSYTVIDSATSIINALLGGLNADLSLQVKTPESGLDIGALIDSFLPEKDAIFGEGVLVLSADVVYTLELKAKLDATQGVDNNLLNIVLKAGDKQVLAVNYLDGMIYINVEDLLKVGIALDLAGYINQLTSLLDGILPFESSTNQTEQIALAGETLQSENNLTLNINEALLNKVLELAGVDAIKFDQEIKINLGFGATSVDSLQVSLLEGTVVLTAQNFLIGKTSLTREVVEQSIGDKSQYGSEVTDIIGGVLSNFSASIDFTMNTIDTNLNLTNIINNIMAKAGSAPLNIPLAIDFSKYSGTFKINFAINMADVAIDNRMMLEVITPEGDMLLSLYAVSGKTYIDLTNLGLMKFALTNMDIVELIKGLLGMTTQDSSAALAMASEGGSIDINNTTITATIQSQFVLKLMRMLMMDIGFDIELNMSASIDGSVNANISTDFMDADLSLKIGKESDDPISTDNINVLDYNEYNALDAEVLVDSILEAQQLYLTIDLYNNNCDTENNKQTRIVIRRSTASAPGQSETLSNGLTASYGSIVVGLYASWSNSNSEVLAWVVLDVNASKLYLKGTEKMFSLLFGAATGELINLNFDMDIKTMLVGLVGGLLGGDTNIDTSIGSGDNVIEVPDGALPEQNTGSSIGANDGATTETTESASLDINSVFKLITLQLTGSLDVNVNLDLNGPYLSNFITTTLTNLFEGGLDISSITGDAADSNVVVDYDNVNADVFFTQLFDKIIVPIVEANVTLVGGLAADMLRTDIHSLVERFLPLSDVEILTANVSLTQGKLANITLIGDNTSSDRGFGIYIFNKKADDVVSFAGQDTQVYYNKTLGIDPASLFETRARKHTTGNWETDSYQDIVWTINGAQIANWSDLNNYEDGIYTAIGTAFGQSITVKIDVHSSNIVSIKDIELEATRDVPDYVTAVFEDGSERVISGVVIDYTRGAYASEEATKTIPATVTIGSNEYSFNIILANETISIETLTVDAYSFKQVFEQMQADGYAKVLVNGEFYKYMAAEYDFSQFESLTAKDLLAGGTYEVKVQVGSGTDLAQELIMPVVVTPFEVYSIEINGKPYLDTDIYENMAGTAFPEQVTVVGFNGTEYVRYTADATWNTQNVIFDKQGGQYIASVVLNQGQYNEWTIPSVVVNVQNMSLAGLVEDTIVLDTMYYFYGGVSFDRLIPGYLDFYTTSGDIKEHVPVNIDTQNITPTLTGGTYVCNVTVGQGEEMYSTTVNVVLPDVTMSLAEEDKVMTMTYEEYVANNGNMFSGYMDIILGTTEVRAKVTWFTDNVVFNEVGEYTAYVIIDQGGAYEQMCAVTVKIVASHEEV